MELTKWDFVPRTSALEAFLEELGRIDEFDDRVRGIREQLENGARALQKEAYELRLMTEAMTDVRIVGAQAEDLEGQAKEARSASLDWERQRLRVYVLRLVTAFEVYLRDFLIEMACDNEAFLRSALDARHGLRLDAPLTLGAKGQRTELIGAYVDNALRTFSNLGEASKLYGQWFAPRKGFTNTKLVAPPLATEEAKRDALADTEILFQIRHVLVHKSGVPNRQYNDLLTHESRKMRLHPSAFEDNDGRVARPPEELLASHAVDPSNATKRDDLYESLMNLARHIDAAYQVSEA